MSDAPRLERRIGLPGAILLSFNGAVGAGIFALPASLAADFGSFAPWLFPAVAILSLLIVLPFARSVAAFPDSGGPATYGRVFGRAAGFELGWVYYIARVSAFAANANVLISYLGRWWPVLGDGLARATVLLAVTAGLAAANIAGTRRALALLGGFTLLKALPLLLVAIAALLMFAPIPAPGPPPPLNQFEVGALLVFYAFVGFENVVVPAGETKRPGTTLPRAILITIATIATLYFLVQLAFVTAFPAGGAGEDAPLIDLGARVLGPAGAVIITLAAIFSLAGNLHGNMTATPRVTYAMGERGDLPGWFARVHHRFASPANSIAVHGGGGRGAGAQRQLRLAGGRQHARSAGRLRRDHRRFAAGSGASAGHRRPLGRRGARNRSVLLCRAAGRCERLVDPGRARRRRAAALRDRFEERRFVERRRCRLGDPAAAEQPRAFVEHRRLARRDAIFRAVRTDLVAIDRRAAPAAPASAPSLTSVWSSASQFQSSTRIASHRERAARADHQPPRLRLDAHDIERLGLAADLDPAALADGEMDHSRGAGRAPGPSRSTISPGAAVSGRSRLTSPA